MTPSLPLCFNSEHFSKPEMRSSDTRAETAATKTKMMTLRLIVGKILRDRVKCSDIRYQCDIQDEVRLFTIRRRAWRDHVDRMSDNGLA